MKIAVVGAGVIGLTSAIRLQEHGFDVTIFARDIQDHIASRAAGAFWHPYKVVAPEPLITRWAKTTLDFYRTLSPELGVNLIPYEEYHPQTIDLPLWARITNEYEEIPADQLPEHYTFGYRANLYRIDTSIYVDSLITQFLANKGHIEQRAFQHLTDVDSSFSIIINCSGVGSNSLVPDPESFPIRGQYILVEKLASVNKIHFAPEGDDNYTLIIPRTNDCYLGGTTLYHDWDTVIDHETTKAILERTQALVPALKDATVLKVGVGLRPGRNLVRLEANKTEDDRLLIHNYGHGGSGFTIGWGCAEEVAELVS